MRLVKCWFCSATIYPGHGIQFVRNDAKHIVIQLQAKLVFFFSRFSGSVSKCHKNFKMKRNPRKVKWTKAFRAAHGKDMTQDKTFEFEKKRNRPERYDRNVTEDTLKAIKKIDKIRSTREADHIKKRFKPNKQKIFKNEVDEIDQNINLIQAPGARLQDSEKMKVLVSKNKSVQNEAMEE